METDKIIPELGDDVPESWLKKALAEVNQKQRIITVPIFRGKDNVELIIKKPSMDVDSKAANVYARYYGKYLKDPDLMTREQLLEILKERNIWGEKQEDEIETLREKMRDLQYNAAQMRRKGGYKQSQMDKIRSQWLELRNKMNQLLQLKSSHLSSSIEGLAEEEEIKVKLSLCVEYPDGKKVWNSVSEINNDEDKTGVMYVFTEAMTFWVGLTQEIIEGLPARLFGGEEESEDSQEA